MAEVIWSPRSIHDLESIKLFVAGESPHYAGLVGNWLGSASGLYSTDRIPKEEFSGLPDYLEMTFLAFSLSLNYKIAYLNEPTFVVHIGAEEQVSRSWPFYKSVPQVLRRMERLTTRPDLRARLRNKRAAALHGASQRALENKCTVNAWRFHMQSLMVGDGWRYLPYTRRLLSK